jgi:hypothetical protein
MKKVYLSIEELMKTTGDDLYLPTANLIDFGDNFIISKKEPVLGFTKQKQAWIFIVKEYNTNNIQVIKFFTDEKGYKTWYKFKLLEGIKIVENEVKKKNIHSYLSEEVMEIYVANNL